MKFRKVSGVLLALAMLLVCACQAAAANSPNPPLTSADTMVRLHWLGKERISADTNSTELLKIWNAPESAKLEAEIVDKLSPAPWWLLRRETNQAPANLLRPLLEDIVAQECYVEIRRATNSPNIADEMVLAIRLNDQRSRLWQTNLAMALESLTGIPPNTMPSGSHWTLKKHHAPNLIEFVRAGEWTLAAAAEDHNGLLDDILARIDRDHEPFPKRMTNVWLDAEIDLPRFATAIWPGQNLPAELPHLSGTVTGNGREVRVQGEIHFPQAFPMVLEPWAIPTNFIDSNLSSFTALRGAAPWLLSKAWTQFETNSPPNQFCFWSIPGIPVETYAAAPFADASNTVSRFSDFALDKAGPWMAKHELARFQRAKSFNGLEWKGLPYIYPFVKSTEACGRPFILAGFFPFLQTNLAPPQPLVHDLRARSSLVYYGWEQTGPRLEQWMYISQLAKVLAGKPEMSDQSAAFQWLKSMVTKLGSCRTEVERTNDRDFTFTRSSTGVGLTALELQLLANWLESPDFPAAEGFPRLHHNF